MTALTIGLACVAVVAAVVAVLALVALRRARRAAVRETVALRERLDALEAGLGSVRMAPAGRASAARVEHEAEHEYVITQLGELTPGPLDRRDLVPVRLTAPAFADAVLRETVVQAASLVQGLRRALAPETRNRIRFEMKREVKRSRKARKVEVKEALREYRARRRDQQAAATGPAGEVGEVVADEGAA